MAKKVIHKELTGAQDLYNFLFEACNIIRGPISQDNFKDYITPLLYYKRISDVYDEETEEDTENNEFNSELCQSNTVLLFLTDVIGKKYVNVLRI